MPSARYPLSFGTRLATHVRAGVAAGACATVVDAVGLLVGGTPGTARTSVAAFVIAVLHVGAWQLFAGGLLGAAVALLTQATAPVPERLLERWNLVGARGWFRPSPKLASDALTALASAGAFVLGVVLIQRRFFHSFHDSELAEWAVALTALCSIVALAFATPLIDALLQRILAPFSIALLPAILVVVAGEFLAVAFEYTRSTRPTLLAGLDDRFLAIAFIAPAAYVASVARSHVMPTLELRRSAFARTMVAALSFAASASLYDATTTHRWLVEEASVLGRHEIRGLQAISDRDHDGHAARFGGGDCDDSRADVHPQAVDVAGDGLDADCFAGDGTPPFDDRMPVPRTTPRPTVNAVPNVLLITVDTLRPDHLHSLGYARRTTPNIDAFARGATVFTDVTAASPRTVRSFGAFLTGLYPGQIEYEVVHLWPEMTQANVTLAERLRPTHATSVLLESDYFSKARGFAQGFERIAVPTAYKPSRAASRQRAVVELHSLAASPRPFFLWVHLFNVHEPYLAEGTPSKFGRGLAASYDTEVALADENVGAILDALRASGKWDQTIVVVASDHGEALGEHRAFGHSTSLYDEQLRAVLIVRFPSYGPRRVDTPVALFDMYATLLDATGVGIGTPTSSRSLLPLALGRDAGMRNRPLFAEVFPDGTYGLEAYAVRRGPYKLIEFPRTNRFELFDLSSDPRELVDLSDQQRAVAADLRSVLRRWTIASHRPENATSNVLAGARLTAVPAYVTNRPRVRFGSEIELEGLSIGATAARGEVVPIDFYFRSLAPIADDYWFHVSFESLNGEALPTDFEGHHQPVEGRYPTSRWIPGELIHDRVLVRIPETLAPGTRLRARLEIWPEPFVPLPFFEGGRRETSYVLGEFVIR